jgi:hypothetical protein
VYPLKLELRKTWHGLSKIQGAKKEHDEHYQMLAGI